MTPGAGWYARRFDATYLEVYAHRDAAEAERVTARLLEPLGLEGKRVLDLACGAGRYVEALAQRGARVVGLDLSAALLESARIRLAARAGVIGLVRADMLHLPFLAARFDLVVSMFTSFGYFAAAAEDRAMLAEVARILCPGGVLLLDFLNAERLRRVLEPETRRQRGRFEVHERRWLDTARNTVVKEIELASGADRHRYREEVRLWSPPELGAALDAVGLEVLERWGDYNAAPFDAAASDRLLLLARRRPPA